MFLLCVFLPPLYYEKVSFWAFSVGIENVLIGERDQNVNQNFEALLLCLSLKVDLLIYGALR